MANRFTDSRKWDDPWFRKLPCKYKAFFIFLLDKCNHAGIWKVDFESAEFHIGEKISADEVISFMEGRIVQLKEKWFIPKFIEFQYQVSIKDLNHSNRVHKSVLDILIKEGAYKPLISPKIGAKDKDYDKDKDKNNNINNDSDKDNINNNVSDNNIAKKFEQFKKKYPKPVNDCMVYTFFKSQIKTDKDFNDMMIALDTYKLDDSVKKKFIKNAENWLGEWRGWFDMAKKPKKEIDQYEVKK